MSKPPVVNKAILAAINKGAGKSINPARVMGSGNRSDVTEFIPTGIEVLDKYGIGRGGLPVGRMTELFSAEGAGKSSLVLSALAQCQKMGGIAIIAETEVALEGDRAEKFGVDLDQLILLTPAHLDEFWAQAEATLKAIPEGVGPVLFAWDSVAATMTKDEFENGIEKSKSFDTRAKSISKGCRALCPLAAEHRAALLFVNQVRDKIGVMFGPKTTTPGGHAIKFHSSLRLQMYPGKSVKQGEEVIGKDVLITNLKNKVGRPHRKLTARLNFDGFWDDGWTTLNFAKDRGLVDNRCRDLDRAKAAIEAAGWGGGSASVAEGVEQEAEEDVDE